MHEHGRQLCRGKQLAVTFEAVGGFLFLLYKQDIFHLISVCHEFLVNNLISLVSHRLVYQLLSNIHSGINLYFPQQSGHWSIKFCISKSSVFAESLRYWSEFSTGNHIRFFMLLVYVARSKTRPLTNLTCLHLRHHIWVCGLLQKPLMELGLHLKEYFCQSCCQILIFPPSIS